MPKYNVVCPDCGSPMVERKNKAKNTRFMGCRSFLKCLGSRNIYQSAEEVRSIKSRDLLIAGLAYAVVSGRISMDQAKTRIYIDRKPNISLER